MNSVSGLNMFSKIARVMLKSLDDDSHVQTRLCQYEAVNNERGIYIAKQFVLGKFYGYKSLREVSSKTSQR